jgi:hypothetical protein
MITLLRVDRIMLVIGMFLFSGILLGETERGDQMVMKNDYWQIKIEPRWGARASSLYSVKHGYDFVSMWEPVKEGRDAGTVSGGALTGMMSGSYKSSQPQEQYTVVRSSPAEASFTYDNRYMFLDGLREEKKISIEGPALIYSVKVTNTGSEDRVIYYRVQDWLGTGLNRGIDSVFVVPWTEGEPFAFYHLGGTGYFHRPFIKPSGRWFALADITGDKGLVVTVEKTDVAAIFFWGSGSDPLSRTAEIFFPRKKLSPGGSWEMELRYTLFSPSNPETLDSSFAHLLAAGNINRYLARSMEMGIRTGLPYDSVMEMPYRKGKVVVFPVHLADGALEGRTTPEYGRTLKSVHLYGTPGEVVPLVIGIRATEDISTGNVSCGNLDGRLRSQIPASSIESRYVAGKSLLLVKDWGLSQNVPFDEILAINNDIKDAERMTPFSIKTGEVAYIYNAVRIPVDAASGDYRGKYTVSIDGRIVEIDVNLTVRPFSLLQAKHKTYGTFFRYFIRSQDTDKESAGKYAIGREEYLKALKCIADVGYNGLIVYVSKREDLLWVMERCRELGMLGGFVLVRSGNLTAEDITGLKKKHNIMGWGIDEPVRYSQIPVGVKRYKSFIAKGLLTPSFTPNVPVGLLMADNLEKIVPIIAMSGNLAYGIDATRRYKNEGRQVYWYRTGQAAATVEQRVFRGIYLWKEPVDGILDWGDDSVAPTFTNHQMAGFAGTDVLPRLGRENIRQALIDLNYLHTLETLTSRCKDAALKEEAEGLMNWIRDYFGDDWYLALEPIKNPQYIDDIRQDVADMIEKLVKAGVR